jgi:chaperonin GroES
MAQTLSPLHDRIVLKRLETQQTTASGIIIPDTAKEKAQYGEVIAAGPGKVANDGSICPIGVKVGDQVLFGKYSGTEVKLEGQEYLIVKEEEILGILK